MDIARAVERCPALGMETGALVGRVLRHPFLERCSAGSVTTGELRAFLVQHGKYAMHFTRYLCALISNLEHGEDVSRLAGNLSEELGYGAPGEEPHATLYARMLEQFGIDLQQEPAYPETQHLVETMFMLCRQPGGLAGLGALCLGAEAIVPAVYAQLIRGFRSRGVEVERLRYFAVHVECDDGHAETMYSIIERRTAQLPASRLSVLSAGDAAIAARLSFFDAVAREGRNARQAV